MLRAGGTAETLVKVDEQRLCQLSFDSSELGQKVDDDDSFHSDAVV